MKQEKTIAIVQYDDCNDCSFCEFPDKDGNIPIPDFSNGHNAHVHIDPRSTFIARCGVSGNVLKELKGCNRWFNGKDIINYHNR